MFTPEYFAWLAICFSFVGILLFFSLKFKFSLKTATYIVCGISVASELCKIFTHMNDASGGGKVLWAGSLPFHLCSILIFLFFYLLISKNENAKKKVMGFVVPIAIIGGLLAIFMSTSGSDFKAPYAYQCYFFHSGILWYAIHVLCTKNVGLGWKTYLRNLATLSILTVVMLWVNSALQTYHTNFFYLVKPPLENLPLLNLKNGWYAYFFTLVALGVILVTLVHAPTMICHAVRAKRLRNTIIAPSKTNAGNLSENDNPIEQKIDTKSKQSQNTTNKKDQI